MNNIGKPVVSIAILAVGVALGYAIPRSSPEPIMPASPEPKAGAATDIADVSAAALRARVAEMSAEIARLKSGSVKTDAASGDEAGSDVKQPVKIQSLFTPAKKKKLAAALDKKIKELTVDSMMKENEKVLCEMDTSWMNEEEIATHNKLLGLIARQAELAVGIFKNWNEDHGASRDEMNKINDELSDVYLQERNMLLRRIAVELGYSSDDADLFVSAIDDIYKTTAKPDGYSYSVSASSEDGCAGFFMMNSSVEKNYAKPPTE